MNIQLPDEVEKRMNSQYEHMKKNEYSRVSLCNEINCHVWPKIIPFKPKDWDYLTYQDKMKNKFLAFIFYILQKITPLKEQYRHWHIVYLNRTNDEFEKWWVENELSCVLLFKKITSWNAWNGGKN